MLWRKGHELSKNSLQKWEVCHFASLASSWTKNRNTSLTPKDARKGEMTYGKETTRIRISYARSKATLSRPIITWVPLSLIENHRQTLVFIDIMHVKNIFWILYLKEWGSEGHHLWEHWLKQLWKMLQTRLSECVKTEVSKSNESMRTCNLNACKMKQKKSK